MLDGADIVFLIETHHTFIPVGVGWRVIGVERSLSIVLCRWDSRHSTGRLPSQCQQPRVPFRWLCVHITGAPREVPNESWCCLHSRAVRLEIQILTGPSGSFRVTPITNCREGGAVLDPWRRLQRRNWRLTTFVGESRPT